MKDQLAFIPELGRDTILKQSQVDKLYSDGFHSPTTYDPEQHLIDPSLMEYDDEELFVSTAAVAQRCAVAKSRSDGFSMEPVLYPSQPMLKHGHMSDASDQAMEFVKDDDPAEHLYMARKYVGVLGKMRPGLFSREKSDFVKGPPIAAAVMDMQPAMVSPHVFAVKWTKRVARPEQIWRRVQSGDLKAPAWFIRLVADWHKHRSDDIYPFNGDHPPHPSFTAMHAGVARSAMVLYVLISLDLYPTLLDELIEHDRVMAHARDSLGVHHWMDSDMGLVVTAVVLRQTIPAAVEFLGGDSQLAARMADQFIAKHSPRSLDFMNAKDLNNGN